MKTDRTDTEVLQYGRNKKKRRSMKSAFTAAYQRTMVRITRVRALRHKKSILTDYVKKQGWHIAKTYVDDGYSGTNFQRPSFQNMIRH